MQILYFYFLKSTFNLNFQTQLYMHTQGCSSVAKILITIILNDGRICF